MRQSLIPLVAIFLLPGCTEQVESSNDKIDLLNLETLPAVVHPVNNPATPAKLILGKFLFYDPILSGEKDIACVTCHIPNYAYGDGRDLSIGVGGKGLSTARIDYSGGRIPVVGRNSPTVVNTAFNGLISAHQRYNPLLAPMFWDGRRKSLESQSLGPPTSFNEMRGDGYNTSVTFDSITARLRKIPEYRQLFDDAFGSPDSITEVNIGKAIAVFERSIVSSNSPYDQYVRGNKSALTEEQKIGLQLFYGKANCSTCHSGPMFSDFNYYNIGIAFNPKRLDPDKGVAYQFLFRTPTLRNVSLTAPYMHDGTLQTLTDVIDHYNKGTSLNGSIESLDSKIKPLRLSQSEKDAIVAFLNGLTDDSYDQLALIRVPSGLKPGGN